MMPLELAFWVAVVMLGYVYLGYPGIMLALARLAPRPLRPAAVTPTVTILIAAHNEGGRIARKLDNCLALAYPPARLDILVVSDGSTDDTARVVQEYARRHPGRVQCVALPVRQGKPSALNVGAALATGEVLVLADVRQTFEPDAVRALVRNFADPSVGAVSGELLLTRPDGGGAGVGLYWRYEKALRHAESRFRSCLHYTGAIAAVRRSLFAPLPAETLHDDVVMALRIAGGGHRVVLEPAARAWEPVSATSGREFGRKLRTQAATLQTILNFKTFVGRLDAVALWQFTSHTVLRLALPYALLVVLVGSAWLPGEIYRAALLAQGLAYGLAGIGLRIEGGAWRRLLSLPATFVVLNGAALIGPLLYIAGRRRDLWRVAVPDAAGASRQSL